MLYTVRFFFSSKCSLFHNANLFGSCIIHILYTGCAKIKKNNSGDRGLKHLKTVNWSIRSYRSTLNTVHLSSASELQHTYLLTYLLTPWCKVLLDKLTGLRLVKKFPVFYGTRRFITALTSVRHLSLSWASPIQSTYPHTHLLEIHPNIIHTSKPRSPQWSLSLPFPLQDPVMKIMLLYLTCASSHQ